MLAVAGAAAVVLAAAQLEGHHAVVAAVGSNLAGHLAAGHEREAQLGALAVLADHQHVVELHGAAGLGLEQFHLDHVTLGDAVLLATGLDYSVHGILQKPFKNSVKGRAFYGLAAPGSNCLQLALTPPRGAPSIALPAAS